MNVLVGRNICCCTGCQASTPQHCVALMDPDGAVVVLARGDRNQVTAGERVVDVSLLIARIDPRSVRQHPHLHEVHRFGLAGVLLAVPNPATGRHALGEPGVQDAVIALAVVVLQLAGQHPGDDLHVAVAVGSESASRGDLVVVVDQQQTVAVLALAVVTAEVERMLGIEPVDVGVEAIGGSLNCDCHDFSNIVALATIPDGSTDRLAVHLQQRIADQFQTLAVRTAEVQRRTVDVGVVDVLTVQAVLQLLPRRWFHGDRQVMMSAEYLLVRAEIEAREVEVGERVAVADVEEEVRRSFVVAILEHLDQREAEDLLVELHGSFDIAADEGDVVHASGGARWALLLRGEVLRGEFGATLRESGSLAGIDAHSGNSTGSVGRGQKTTDVAPAATHRWACSTHVTGGPAMTNSSSETSSSPYADNCAAKRGKAIFSAMAASSAGTSALACTNAVNFGPSPICARTCSRYRGPLHSPKITPAPTSADHAIDLGPRTPSEIGGIT